jgi:hypothetical protein
MSSLKPGTRLVAFALSTYMSERGDSAWPGVSRLATDTALTPRSVRRHLALLEDEGYVGRTFRLGQTTLYFARTPDSGVLPPRTPVSGDPGQQCPPTSQDHPEKSPGAARAPRERRPRARDDVWDALVEVFGFAPASKTQAHGKRNKAVKELKAHGATSEKIKAAADAWPRKFPGATLTDIALATHYPALLAAAPKRQTGMRPLDAEESG